MYPPSSYMYPSYMCPPSSYCTCILLVQSRYMSERKLEPKDVPGTFLNLALLNLGSTSATLRTSAYKLLSAVKDTFKLRIDRHLESSHDLCIPMNSSDFVVGVSRELALKEPHLTLEFLSEVVAGFQQYTPAMKQLCLMYMSPWLPNLSRFFAAMNESPACHKKVSTFTHTHTHTQTHTCTLVYYIVFF